ncbi:MAG: hypothetical protein J7L03_05325 [Caldisericaceae bacterium]|jgi:FdrA protein|nr:hypothetical protein [Caldisericaceae bacterium]
MRKISDLFKQELKVINIGLLSFKESLEDVGVKVIQVDWRPPAGGDEEVMDALKKLLGK